MPPSTLDYVTVPVDLWDEILEFIDQHVDVRDGSDGRQLPNDAMSLQLRLIEAGLSND